MLTTLGLLGLLALGWATFQLGREQQGSRPLVLAVGVVGLLAASMAWGILAVLLVVAGCFLIGQGLRPGGVRVVPLGIGLAILAAPFMLGGLFYLASLNA